MSASPPPLILVHGAWHGAWCWSRLLPLLRARGQRVLTPDLPRPAGEGEAPGRVSLRHYAQSLVKLLDTLEGPAVLVGHSMSGMVISQVAELAPQGVAALVYLAAFLPRDGDSVFSLMAEMKDSQGPSPIEACMRFSTDRRLCTLAPQAADLLYNHCPSDERAGSFARLVPQPTLPLAAKARLSEDAFATVPRIYLRCLDDRLIPPAHQDIMLARQPGARVIDLDSDHSPFLSHPEALASLLREALPDSPGNDYC